MWPLNLVDASYLREGEEGLAIAVAPGLVDDNNLGKGYEGLALDVAPRSGRR